MPARRPAAVADAVRLVLVAIADDGERPRFQPARLAPMHQRVLLAVRHPDFGGAGRGDGGGQAIPVGVVGNDERQLDAALARPRAHPHPARREAVTGSGKRRAHRSFIADGGQSVMVPASSAFFAPLHQLERTEVDAAALVVTRDLLHRAVQIDRLVVTGRRSSAMTRCALPSE